jgi:ribosome recycling factor
MPTEYKEYSDKMKKTAEILSAQFAAVRAGRANAAVLEKIEVDYYGSPTPIHQIASISTPIRVRWSFSPGMPPY